MNKRTLLSLMMVLLVTIYYLNAQSEINKVPEAKMQQVYEEIRTPYKYGLVLVPPNDSKKIDCPGIFRKGNKWYMTYLIFDGQGYETWLAQSKDLLSWQNLGCIMSFSSDTSRWDRNQKAGYIAVQDYNWGGTYEWQKYDGKYWMTYFGGHTTGYESGLLSLGIAYSDQKPYTVHEWQYLEKPIFTPVDKDVRWWENKKLYKSSVIWDKNKTLGHPFVMYYNANGDTTNVKKTRWFERIGMAVSDDMVHWQRYLNEPVMQHPVGITADAVVQKMDNVWVMFYYGAFWTGRKDAFNRFACSYDLVNWTDWTGDDLIKPSEEYDAVFAHKSFVVKYKGIVYHFYCAVNKKEQRGIAVATSKDLGKSAIGFVGNK